MLKTKCQRWKVAGIPSRTTRLADTLHRNSTAEEMYFFSTLFVGLFDKRFALF